jgi:hypothetical protein
MSDDVTGGGDGPADPDAEAGGASEPGGARSPAGELLGELAALRHRARSARHAYWFPLALFGLIGCGAVPLYLVSGQITGLAAGSAPLGAPALPVVWGRGSGPQDVAFQGSGGGTLLALYWLLTLVAGFLLMMAWYRRHARQAGVTSPARGAALTGIALTILALVLPPVANFTGLSWLELPCPWFLIIHGMYPFLIIAVPLCVLAWAERSLALTVIAVIYLAVTVVACSYDVENIPARFGWYSGSYWFRVIPNLSLPVGCLLLAGAAAFALRPRPRSVPRPRGAG